eukprot:scaffold870_cov268-Pinguiococcus_pyrenoidosus.AAC.16
MFLQPAITLGHPRAAEGWIQVPHERIVLDQRDQEGSRILPDNRVLVPEPIQRELDGSVEASHGNRCIEGELPPRLQYCSAHVSVYVVRALDEEVQKRVSCLPHPIRKSTGILVVEAATVAVAVAAGLGAPVLREEVVRLNGCGGSPIQQPPSSHGTCAIGSRKQSAQMCPSADTTAIRIGYASESRCRTSWLNWERTTAGMRFASSERTSA